MSCHSERCRGCRTSSCQFVAGLTATHPSVPHPSCLAGPVRHWPNIAPPFQVRTCRPRRSESRQDCPSQAKPGARLPLHFRAYALHANTHLNLPRTVPAPPCLSNTGHALSVLAIREGATGDASSARPSALKLQTQRRFLRFVFVTSSIAANTTASSDSVAYSRLIACNSRRQLASMYARFAG